MSKYLILLLLFSLYSLSSYSNETNIKSILEAEIKTTYIDFLKSHFGECSGSDKSCIREEDNYLVASFRSKEICLPYTKCGFYHCMEKKYQCEEVGVNYFTELAFPTCNQYVKNISDNKFSNVAVEWIYSVMVCLQKGLVEECEVRGNCEKESRKKTCDHITDFTLKYHPGCYLNSGVGVCHLPLKDKLAIWKTVNPFMTKREREEAYKVIFSCIKPKSYFHHHR